MSSVVVDAVGRATLDGLRTARRCLRLGAASVAALRELEPKRAIREAYELANRSLFFVVVIMGFTGAILVIQASLQAQRLIGDLSGIGPAFLQLLLREFGPTIVAMMVAARYGAGVAAELAAMTISEQVDAQRMSGAEPPAYLVLPRMLGGLIGGMPLTIFGCLVAFGAGAAAMTVGFGVGFDTFASLKLVSVSDVVVGLVKACAFGVAVPLCASDAGLTAFGGAPGVGRATTRAVIGSSIAVLALDLLIGVVAYVVEVMA